ncbi:MAG: type II toxin-antitoxin system HipA family toxin [Steroidobacteraceae bacterium]
MTLYLVGETIDKTRSHYLAETGKIIQLMRGIYIDAADDVDATVFGHAIRIARYLYPHTYLSAASAIALAPTRDGRLFLSGRRNLRTRIRGLEIIQNVAPTHPSLGAAVIADSLGEFRIEASSIRQRFLEAFRLRSEHASSIDDGAREALVARLIEEYGTPKTASDATWALARENEWYREGEAAERFLNRNPVAAPSANVAVLNLVVAWHGAPIGQLNHDGFEWRWVPIPGAGPALVRQTTPGQLPPFIVSLLPEGWLEAVLDNHDERAILRSGRRYMSNITIAQSRDELAQLPADILVTRLDQFVTNNVFTGTYTGPGRTDLEHTFEQNLARIYERADTPRLSGVQIKAPMHLDAQGNISPATEKSFTHILKPAGTSGFETLPLIEWTALALGKSVGFDVPATALMAMPDGMPPALLVERFDIRQGSSDTQLLAMEDLCSVLDLPPDAKYDGTMERVARSVRALSTSADIDMMLIVKRALFAWLIADGDMHLKNMALLKIADPGSEAFRTVRVAPLYDAVTTRVFPRLAKDRMALKVNGKDERLKRTDFRALANIAGLQAAATDAAIDEMLQRLAAALKSVALPKALAYAPQGEAAVSRMIALCRERTESFE